MALGAITRIAGRAGLVLSKHTPTILTYAGIGGFVGTSVLASRATLTYRDKLAQEFEDFAGIAEAASRLKTYTVEDQRRDKAIMYARIGLRTLKHYALPLALGAASAASIVIAHNMFKARIAALGAAYAAVTAAYENYKRKMVDSLGEDTVKKILATPSELEATWEDGPDGRKIFEISADLENGAPSPYARVFDQSYTDWSSNRGNTEMFLNAVQNHMNDLLHARGHVFLNEVYDALGMERTQAGAVVGWVRGNGDDTIDFGIGEGEVRVVNHKANRSESIYCLDFNVDGVIWDKI